MSENNQPDRPSNRPTFNPEGRDIFAKKPAANGERNGRFWGLGRLFQRSPGANVEEQTTHGSYSEPRSGEAPLPSPEPYSDQSLDQRIGDVRAEIQENETYLSALPEGDSLRERYEGNLRRLRETLLNLEVMRDASPDNLVEDSVVNIPETALSEDPEPARRSHLAALGEYAEQRRQQRAAESVVSPITIEEDEAESVDDLPHVSPFIMDEEAPTVNEAENSASEENSGPETNLEGYLNTAELLKTLERDSVSKNREAAVESILKVIDRINGTLFFIRTDKGLYDRMHNVLNVAMATLTGVVGLYAAPEASAVILYSAGAAAITYKVGPEVLRGVGAVAGVLPKIPEYGAKGVGLILSVTGALSYKFGEVIGSVGKKLDKLSEAPLSFRERIERRMKARNLNKLNSDIEKVKREIQTQMRSGREMGAARALSRLQLLQERAADLTQNVQVADALRAHANLAQEALNQIDGDGLIEPFEEDAAGRVVGSPEWSRDFDHQITALREYARAVTLANKEFDTLVARDVVPEDKDAWEAEVKRAQSGLRRLLSEDGKKLFIEKTVEYLSKQQEI